MNSIILIGIPIVLVITCLGYKLTEGVEEPQRGGRLSVFTAILIMFVLLWALHSTGIRVEYTV